MYPNFSADDLALSAARFAAYRPETPSSLQMHTPTGLGSTAYQPRN